MLSSKHTHKSPKDMAPEPISFLSKMRKSISGKPYRRNSGDFSHATHSPSVSFPQMDADTAMAYIRDSSNDKTRQSGNIAVASSSNGNCESMPSAQASLSDTLVHMNGKVPNGRDLTMDENANNAPTRQDCHDQPNRSKISVFEKQGARPKVRKTSKGEVTYLVEITDKSDSPEGGRNDPQGRPVTLSTVELPRVEMEQPNLPFHETSSVCSMNRKESRCPSTGSPSGERTTDLPDTNMHTVPCDSVTDVLPHLEGGSSKSRASTTKASDGETDIPHSSPHQKPVKNVQEIESTTCISSEEPVHVDQSVTGSLIPPTLPETSASAGVSCILSDEMKVVETEHTASPSTQSCTNGELLTTDLIYSSVSDVQQVEMHTQANTAVSASVLPITNQSHFTSCGEDTMHVSSIEGESGIMSDTCYKQNGMTCTNSRSTEIDGNVESHNVTHRTLKESTIENGGTFFDEGKSSSKKQTCPSDEISVASKHCCTCTCGNEQNETHPHKYVPNNPCDNTAKKSALSLDGISLEMADETGSPPKARTPHIAMIINSDGMFTEEDTQSKLSVKDLDMISKWKAFSLEQENQEPTCNEEKKLRTGTVYSETTKAFGAMKVTEEATDSPADRSSQDNPSFILGAIGGVDTDSTETDAPRIDRSSKPRELRKPPDNEEDDAAEEEPPPLPPRLPATPGNVNDNNRGTMSAFQYFDDDDDDIPTHEFLNDIRMELYIDAKNNIKSKSLPRNATPVQSTSPPEMRAIKRGKTVNMRNRFSQMFKPGSKKKRHSTHGFPDRPLPDIPLNSRLAKTSENTRQSSYFGTTSGDIVSQQAIKEGLLKESQSKDEVDKAREQFAVSLRKISEYGWYWGPMSWDDAESRLENMPDGSFLVRDSSDDRHLLSLSFRAQGSTHHTRVEHQNGKFSFWSQPCSHGSASIVEFVEEAMRHSRSGRVLYFLRPRMPGYPPAAVQLLYPISRFQKSRSLQHMCRFVIRKHVRLDHIDNLPLPRRLKDYLKEAQYYTQEDILH